MSFISTLKEKVETASKKINEIAEELKVPEDVRESRFLICSDCDRLLKTTHTCKECGCFMKAKTWLKSAKCPLGKW